MKNLIKILMCFLLLNFSVGKTYALSLVEKEVLFLNSISRFLDSKPEGQPMKLLEKALVSKNPLVKGLGSLILYRHFGRQFKRIFQTSFTLNSKIDAYRREERKFIKLENVNKILENLEPALTRLNDDRLRRLFLFFHFRHIDLWLVGRSGEQLSLAIFYRISSLDSVFGPGVDVRQLADLIDSREK